MFSSGREIVRLNISVIEFLWIIIYIYWQRYILLFLFFYFIAGNKRHNFANKLITKCRGHAL